MKIAIITINANGEDLAKKIKVDFPDAKVFSGRMSRQGALKELIKNIFDEYDGLIFIAALGIVIRLIGALIKSKFSDPAVVSVDSAGRFSISVLSGHEGGANRLAFLVASSLDAVPVVTTGEEVHKKLIVGIGTRRGVEATRVKRAVINILRKRRIKLKDVRIVTTIELKKNERGLIKACSDMKVPLVFISKETIAGFKGRISKSEVVKRHIGLEGVCEPCALLGGRKTRLILKKEIYNGVAIAIAEED